MMLYQITLFPSGKAEEKIRVKLNGKWPNFQIIMTEEGIVAMCSAEKDVRLWDLNREDSGVISLQTSKGFSAGDTVTCLSYSPRKGCLSGGTSDGKVATWKRRAGNTDESIEGDWKLQEAVEIGSQVIAICWAISSNSLAVSTGFSVTILKEQPILSHMSNSLVAVQTGNMSLLLIRLKPTEQQEMQLTFAVKGVFVGEKNIAVWDHEQVTIYELIDSTHSPH
uniref:Intraflagellar transport protein 140 n=1 Tax=Ascaris suum TaxID=6253 RepID=F1LEK2_ASCSU